jgi:aminoglycoside phosphotransferase (APT) family kinase protein
LIRSDRPGEPAERSTYCEGMRPPGELLASGRDADIFEYGAGQVLRRSRNGHSMSGEARTMEYVRSRGYPVPEIFDLSDDGCDVAMERINGPTMVDAGAARPWRLKRYGRQLAELHQSLHELSAPEWLPGSSFGRGTQLLHLDLHPLNVLMSPDGPIVIDWANAASGDPSFDVALTWVLIASGDVPKGAALRAVIDIGRRLILNAFLEPFSGDELRAIVEQVVRWKATDPHMSAVEIGRMQALVSDASALPGAEAWVSRRRTTRRLRQVRPECSTDPK